MFGVVVMLIAVVSDANKLREHWDQFESNVERMREAQEPRHRWLMLEGSGRRNHGCAFVGNRLIEVLGRWAESVEEMTLSTHKEPDQRLRKCLDCDLNHVVAVPVVDEKNTSEIWLPCGFEGHRVGNETSTRRARIVDANTLEVRRGPALEVPGGACAALGVATTSGTLAICSFGGTDGSHDDGKFLKSVKCYDRRGKKWFEPFEPLPFGLDHANAVVVEAGACRPKDPAKILLMNFRSEHYANMRTEVFAAEIPSNGVDAKGGMKQKWTLFSNDTASLPRDASGAATVARGKYVLQFGGVFYAYGESLATVREADADAKDLGSVIGATTSGPLRAKQRGWHLRVDFSEIRALDVCGTRDWLHVGRMQSPRFATQTCRSKDLVVTCGGRPGGRKQRAAKNVVGTNSSSKRDDLGVGPDRQNMRNCELHRTKHLEVMVQSAKRRSVRRRESPREHTALGLAHVTSLLRLRRSNEEEDIRRRRILSSSSEEAHEDDAARGKNLQRAILSKYGRPSHDRILAATHPS